MLIDEIRKGENVALEFKRDVPRDSLKFLKTVVAFANGTGGRIIFGVDDDRSIVGLDEMAAFKIADGIIDTIANGCTPSVAVNSEVSTVDGKTIVLIDVSGGRHCPYFVKSLGLENGTFVRVGATSRLAGEMCVRDLEFSGSGQSFDSQVCPGLSVVPTELKRLCSTMYRVARANCEDAAVRKMIKRVTPAQLEDWGILVRNGQKLLPTYAYALLTGSRKFWAEVKCGVFRGTSRAFFRSRREYTGSVIKQIDSAFDFVMEKIDVGMKVVGVQGVPDYELPPSAVRELIVNAIVHRNYINPLAMSVQVALYDDRLEVTSPGGLPHGMSVKMMMEGHSIARNRALALACRYMHIIEAWGSGIPRINELLAEAHLQPVAVEDNGIDMRFILWRRRRVKVGEPVNEPVNDGCERVNDGCERVNERVNGDRERVNDGRERVNDGRERVNERVNGGRERVNGGRERVNEPVNEPVTVDSVIEIVRRNPGIRIPDIVRQTGLSTATIRRYFASASGFVVFRGAPKTGGYFAVETED